MDIKYIRIMIIVASASVNIVDTVIAKMSKTIWKFFNERRIANGMNYINAKQIYQLRCFFFVLYNDYRIIFAAPERVRHLHSFSKGFMVPFINCPCHA